MPNDQKHNLTYQECPKHSHGISVYKADPNDICGCPRTKRTNGLYVYKSDITGNWIVWDVEGQAWLSLSGSWQTAMNTANLYLACRPHRFDDEWHICVPAPTEA